MAKKKTTKKKLKVVKTEPKKLTVGEALEMLELSHTVTLLRNESELFKSRIDVAALKLQAAEQEVEIKKHDLIGAKTDLRLHGESVMTAEQRYEGLRKRLCEKYEVDQLSYDEETLVIEE